MNSARLEEIKALADKGELFGSFEGIPSELYHSMKNYVSSSGLAALDESAAHYKCKLEEPFEPTRDMDLGTAIHQYILERELFEQSNVLGPDVATRNSKEWRAFEAMNPGKMCWKPVEWDQIVRTAKNALEHEQFVAILKGSKREVSIFWQDPETGILCKCRPDILTTDGLTPDLKSTKSANPKKFQWAVVEYKYHMRAAFYAQGIKVALGLDPNIGILLAVEKTSPFNVQPYNFERDEKRGIHPLEEGERMRRRLMAKLKSHMEENEWPGYGKGFLPLYLPDSENYRISELESA